MVCSQVDICCSFIGQGSSFLYSQVFIFLFLRAGFLFQVISSQGTNIQRQVSSTVLQQVISSQGINIQRQVISTVFWQVKFLLYRAMRINLVPLHYIRNCLFTSLAFVQTCSNLSVLDAESASLYGHTRSSIIPCMIKGKIPMFTILQGKNPCFAN